MGNNEVIVIGTGGHSKVASEIIRQNGWRIAGYVDEGPSATTFLSSQVYKNLSDAQSNFPEVKHAFVAIGASQSRRRWHLLLLENDYNIPVFIHRTAWASDSAILSPGTLVCANAVIGADCRIEDSVIINCSVVLDHDSQVGAFTHLSQGVITGGGVKIGSHVLVGPGSTIEKLAEIADGTTLPSMSLVVTPHK